RVEHPERRARALPLNLEDDLGDDGEEKCAVDEQSGPARPRDPLEHPASLRRRSAAPARPQRSALLGSWSNHIPNRAKRLTEIRSRATSTIVGVVISLPMKRSTTSIVPRRRPSSVISPPST